MLLGLDSLHLSLQIHSPNGSFPWEADLLGLHQKVVCHPALRRRLQETPAEMKGQEEKEVLLPTQYSQAVAGFLHEKLQLLLGTLSCSSYSHSLSLQAMGGNKACFPHLPHTLTNCPWLNEPLSILVCHLFLAGNLNGTLLN